MAEGTIGDYAYELDFFGSGQYATVHYARRKDDPNGTVLALKRIGKKKLNEKLRASVALEVDLMKQLEHPNIVALVDIQETPDHLFLFMELCAGGDLGGYISTAAPLEEASARFFVRQLAAGLEYLRTHDIVHRDLKPQNLLLTARSPDAVLKIADFGFARLLETEDLAATLCGTPLYMAPEILTGKSYSAKADLWSTGAILFEMLTKRRPFSANSILALVTLIQESTEVAFPTNVIISDACRDLVASLLQKDPVRRVGFSAFFAHDWIDLETFKDDFAAGTASASRALPATPHFGHTWSGIARGGEHDAGDGDDGGDGDEVTESMVRVGGSGGGSKGAPRVSPFKETLASDDVGASVIHITPRRDRVRSDGADSPVLATSPVRSSPEEYVSHLALCVQILRERAEGYAGDDLMPVVLVLSTRALEVCELALLALEQQAGTRQTRAELEMQFDALAGLAAMAAESVGGDGAWDMDVCVNKVVYRQAITLVKEAGVHELLSRRPEAASMYRSAAALLELLRSDRETLPSDRAELATYLDLIGGRLAVLAQAMGGSWGS